MKFQTSVILGVLSGVLADDKCPQIRYGPQRIVKTVIYLVPMFTLQSDLDEIQLISVTICWEIDIE